MRDEPLTGMWKYALTRKLRKRINKVATLKLALKLDPQALDLTVKALCGTIGLNEDCPFYLPTNEPHRCGYCLAPNNDKLWYEERELMKQYISPVYRKNYRIVGCYMYVFAERGYQVYLRLERWRRRLSRKEIRDGRYG